MNHHLLSAACLLLVLPAGAQSIPDAPAPEKDPVLQAILEFNRRDLTKQNEVTVVLDPPASDIEPQPLSEPVLVTGTPPKDAKFSEDEEDAKNGQEEAPTPLPESQNQKGPAIKVEQLKTGGGPVDPADVKLSAPFPAKPLSKAPAGWKFDTSETVPPFSREVEIAPGTTITLSIRPHSLIPDVDGATGFSVLEPGFDPALGYDQTNTVGAVLSHSLEHLDQDSRQMSVVIDHLQQLLISLPESEEIPVAKPANP